MSSLLQDVRYGFRLLLRQRGFTAIATLVLALGIGANTAVFSLINALMFKPRAGHTDGAIVGVFSKDRTTPDKFRAFSYPNYVDLRAHTDVFASLAAHNVALAGITEGNATRRVLVDIVTANFFETFGAPLVRGRTFTAAEERPGADLPVAVLSFGAWQRMGRPENVLGQAVQLNGRQFTIVGVAADGFGGSLAIVAPELWVPMGVYDKIVNDFMREGLTGTLADRQFHNLIVLAQLRPGATIESTAAAVTAAGVALEQAFPADNKDQNLMLAPLSRLSISTRPQTDEALTGLSAALLSMSSLVLIVASFNLANMLLARGGSRRKEFAIRLAIGGSRARLVRQLLTEGLVLATLGGVAGLVVARWATDLLVSAILAVAPVRLTFDSTPDVRVLAATAGFCVLSTVVFGLFPAWKLARTDAVPELKDQAGELARGRRSRWAAENWLVMGQLAGSLVMIAVAGLFLRSATAAAKADPGFSFDRGVMIRVDAGLAGYDADRGRALYSQLLERLRARPDVRAAALASIMPFGEISESRLVQRAGAPIKADDARAKSELADSALTSIGTDYFKSLGLEIRRGRDFTAGEMMATAGPRIAIIDEPLARKLFGDEDPVGREVQYAARQEGEAPVVLDVVGVAPGLRQDLFDAAPVPHLYLPFGRDFRSDAYFHLRTSALSADTEAALLPGLRELVRSVDSNLPILSIETRPMFRDRSEVLAFVRFGAGIFTTFGAVALFLAAVGVYGVKAYVVSRRTREIGIRMALGATPGGVVWMVLREGLVPSSVGLAIGLALALAAGTGLRGMAYEGHGVDAAMLGASLAVLVGSTLLASWVPAWRATRIQPVRALRAE